MGGGGGTSVRRLNEASNATRTERTLLVLTDVVAAKVLARLSSKASTASLLSFRFTMSSSGTGTNGSSVSATTCSHNPDLLCLSCFLTAVALQEQPFLRYL